MTTVEQTINPLEWKGETSFALFDVNNYTFTNVDEMSYRIDGKNLVATANVALKLTGTIAGGCTVDGYNVAAGEYDLYLIKSGSVGEQANKYMFQLTPNYNGEEATEKHYLYVYLEKSDFNVAGDTVTLNDIAWDPNANTHVSMTGVTLTLGGEDYAKDYYNALSVEGAKWDAVSEAMYNLYGGSAGKDYEYTFENFAADSSKAQLTINGDNMLDNDGALWTVNMTEDNKYLGTRLWEKAVSTSAKEVFDLKGGHDEIRLSGNFGTDTVSVTKGDVYGENAINLDFYKADGTTKYADVPLVYTEEGNNLKISANVEYYATADVYGTLWGNTVYSSGTTAATAQNPAKYEFRIAQYSDTQFKNTDYEDKYLWKATTKYGDVTKDGQTKARYLALDGTDFTTANVHDDTTGTGKHVDLANVGGGATVSNLKIWKKVNDGEAIDVTAQYYADLEDSYTIDKGSAVAATMYNDQISGSVILTDYLKKETVYDTVTSGSSTYDLAMTVVNVNGNNLESLPYSPVTDSTGKKFTGSRLAESIVSGSADESFDLGTTVAGPGMKDKITFVGSYGNDTVTANEREMLNLDFGDTHEVKYEKAANGKDVVLSTDVEYYATADVYGTLWGNTVYSSGTTAATAQNPAKYEFRIAQYSDTQFKNTDYEDKYLWKATTKYGDVTKDGQTKARYLAVDGTDFATANVHDDTTGTGKHVDLANVGGGATVSNLKIWKKVNDGEAIDVTAQYYAALEGSYTIDKGSAVAATMYNDQISGSVTIKDYVVKDPGAYINVDGKVDEYLAAHEWTVVGDSKGNYEGTRLIEVANSTEAKETFNLGSGSDTINFNGTFGDDTVTINKDENLSLTFNNYGALNFDMAKNKKDLVISAEVEYYAKADVVGKLWGNAVGTTDNPAKYEFRIAQYSDTQFKNTDYEDKYLWKATTKYGDVTKDGQTKARYLALDGTDFNVANQQTDGSYKLLKVGEQNSDGGATVSNLRIYQKVNGVETDVTAEYVAALNSTYTIDKGSAVAATMYANQIDGEVTVKNFSSYKDYLTVNGNRVAFEVTPDKNNKYTGDKNDNVAYSTDEDEVFDLKQGKDRVVFAGDFGEDRVKLTKGEELNLEFASGVLTKELDGNDLVITAGVDYYATADVYGTLWGNTVYSSGTTAATAQNPAKYVFEIAEYNDVQFKDTDYEGKYLWKATTKYGDVTKGGQTLPRYLALDGTDFAGAEYDAGSTTKMHVDLAGVGEGATVSNLKIWKKVNDGEAIDVTAEYYAALNSTYTIDKGSEIAAKMYVDEQLSGTVVVENFAKDTGAKLSINGSAYSYTNNVDVLEEAVKGKITTGSTDDKIDASQYMSTSSKGLTINSGSGDDTITGTSFNDTVTLKSLAGQSAYADQIAGTNKVTFGKGNDEFFTWAGTYTGLVKDEGGYSSNTVNMGVGDNKATLASEGTNKVTAKNGNNEVVATAGVNTIKLGNASDDISKAGVLYKHNEVSLGGGQNKVTSGKGVDEYAIIAGNNNINSGAGEDKFTIAGGYNVIKTGAGDKDFTVTGGITGGTNMITTNKGNDKFLISGGKNIIDAGAGNDTFTVTGAAFDYVSLKGGAGNDTYDMTGVTYGNVIGAKDVYITDTKGTNTLSLLGKDDIFFNVTVGKNGKGTAGTDLFFTKHGAVDDATDDTTDIYTDYKSVKGIHVSGKNAISNVQIGESTYKLDLGAVTEAVAGWLTKNNYKSVEAVLAGGKADDINKVLAYFTDNNAANYKPMA